MAAGLSLETGMSAKPECEPRDIRLSATFPDGFRIESRLGSILGWWEVRCKVRLCCTHSIRGNPSLDRFISKVGSNGQKRIIKSTNTIRVCRKQKLI